ncbi:hypothetical protein Ahy_Scaffold8g108394 [Arachis hypogaea]|uniref:Uncharacterized protein n=1 Tax=Arachis hypogaea TaxID=3818 RepID=A0A444WNW1_ARAHY|nr:hypothetical protein Ahy_Scaffold8g108394 [Arachis hypogaea]
MHSEGEAGEGRKGAFRPWHPKVRQPCCKYFLWLDEHIASLGVGVTRYLGHEQILHGEEHHWNKEDNVAGEEDRSVRGLKKSNWVEHMCDVCCPDICII